MILSNQFHPIPVWFRSLFCTLASPSQTDSIKKSPFGQIERGEIRTRVSWLESKRSKHSTTYLFPLQNTHIHTHTHNVFIHWKLLLNDNKDAWILSESFFFPGLCLKIPYLQNISFFFYQRIFNFWMKASKKEIQVNLFQVIISWLTCSHFTKSFKGFWE